MYIKRLDRCNKHKFIQYLKNSKRNMPTVLQMLNWNETTCNINIETCKIVKYEFLMFDLIVNN